MKQYERPNERVTKQDSSYLLQIIKPGKRSLSETTEFWQIRSFELSPNARSPHVCILQTIVGNLWRAHALTLIYPRQGTYIPKIKQT